MKRFLSLVVLCFCVLLASPKYIGDVNGDGAITVADVTAMVNIRAATPARTPSGAFSMTSACQGCRPPIFVSPIR